METYQLKATDNIHSIREHQENYEDIEILVSSESAVRMNDVSSSGFSNEDLSSEVRSVLIAVEEGTDTTLDRAVEATGLVGLAVAGRDAISVLQGRVVPTDAAKNTIKKVSQIGVSTSITAFLFS